LNRLDGLAIWLADEAPHGSVGELFTAFCRELVRRGFPVWRASLGLEVLHPEVSGWLHVWTDEGTVARQSARAGVTLSPSYRNSPTRVVDETDVPFRRRLHEPCPDMPVLDELRELGATDYVMFPLPFLDRTRTAVASFATCSGPGFSEADLEDLRVTSRLLAPYLERHVLRRIAIDLLDTYVGPRTGRRIIEGQIEPGHVELIEAAIWFVDLRGFTRLSEEAPLDRVLAGLNIWFATLATAVEAQGGEILKFIGDAVLAIFPTAPEHHREEACRRALAAAEELCRAADRLNAERETAGQPAFHFGLALHVGEVAYGNVGAPRRLDFTVMGPAVNRASRLQDVAKRLGLRVVISAEAAQAVGRPLKDLGMQELRDVEPQPVFTLSLS
jgi:adenylate cyclase